jgi:hypothetical protein
MLQTLPSTVSTQSVRPNHVLVQCVGVTTAARTKRPECEANSSDTSEGKTLRICGATPHSHSRRGAKLQQGHLYFYVTTQFSVYGLDCPGIESPWERDFPPVQTGLGAHPAFCTMGTGSFPGVKCGWGVPLAGHPLLAPRSWKSRAIPLPSFWATTGPVTGLLYFTFTQFSVSTHLSALLQTDSASTCWRLPAEHSAY